MSKTSKVTEGCPWCGKQPSVLTSMRDGEQVFKVMCTRNECPQYVHHQTRDQAVEQWNTRHRWVPAG